jgi:hypothetical protein
MLRSTPKTQPKSLDMLLADSLRAFFMHFRVLLLLSVFLSCLSGLARWGAGYLILEGARRTELHEEGVPAWEQGGAGALLQYLQEQKAASAVVREAMIDRFLRRSIEAGDMKSILLMLGLQLTVLGILSILLLFVFLFGIFASLSAQKRERLMFREGMRLSGHALSRSSLLCLWIFLRTFAWVPVLGIIFFVLLGPRYVLAFPILLREGRSIRESAHESLRRTKGYYWTILRDLVAIFLMVLFVAVFCTIVVAQLIVWTLHGLPLFLQFLRIASFDAFLLSSVLGLPVGIFLGSILQYLFLALLPIFLTQLYFTITLNPRVSSTAVSYKPGQASKAEEERGWGMRMRM